MNVRCGDVVLAKLSPARRDDLTPAAAAIVGQAFLWTAVRVIGEDDGVGYDGHLRMELGGDAYQRTGVWWVPLCDLTDVTVVGSDARVARECELLHEHQGVGN